MKILSSNLHTQYFYYPQREYLIQEEEVVIKNLIRLNLVVSTLLPLDDFSERTRNVLLRETIVTLDHLLAESKHTLLNLQGFGSTSLFEILKYLDQLGLVLGSHLKDEDGRDLIHFDALSERTRNCLKGEDILTIQQLEKIQAADLMGIKHFGENSLKDVNNYLSKIGKKQKIYAVAEARKTTRANTKLPKVAKSKRAKYKKTRIQYRKEYEKLDKTKPRKLSIKKIDLSKNVVIFPAGNKQAYINFQNTVQNFYSNEELNEYFTPGIKEDLVSPKWFRSLDNYGYWGVNTSSRVFAEIETPCYGIFFKDKEGFQLVEINNKFIDTKLSSLFWDKIDEKAFQYMFQINSIVDINLSQQKFNEFAGWSEKMVSRMFVYLKYPKSYTVLNYLKNN